MVHKLIDFTLEMKKCMYLLRTCVERGRSGVAGPCDQV